MPARFDVDGPHVIPRTQHPGGNIITRENGAEFWSQHADIAKDCGCYVFGVRNGRGVLPGYVGKATTGFAREVFQPHKLNRYHEYLAKTRKGTPVLFFLVAARNRGKLNERAIVECEQELIRLAKRTNPDLVNVHGTKGPAFIIPHVTEGVRGRPSAPALALCQTLGIEIIGGDETRRISPSEQDEESELSGGPLLPDSLETKNSELNRPDCM